MTENEKLRALLAEARGLIAANRLVLGEHQGVREVRQMERRIDAALAEPVVDLQMEYERDREAWDATAEKMDALMRGLVEHRSQAERERDEARAEVACLKKRFDDQWYECHDGSEQACCKSHE